MDFSIAIKGEDFVIMLSDKHVARSIFQITNDEEKLFDLNDNQIMCLNGEQCDRLQFGDWILKLSVYERLNTGNSLTTPAISNWIRYQLAKSIRSRKPYQINVLVGGIDEGIAKLYYIDYLGTLVEQNYSVQGYIQHFATSVIDSLYKKGLTQDDALCILKKTLDILDQRFFIKKSSFQCKVVDKNGIRNLQI